LSENKKYPATAQTISAITEIIHNIEEDFRFGDNFTPQFLQNFAVSSF